MSVTVNLLPGAYIKRRRHHRRFRIALFAGCVLLGAELIVGIIVHGRAERARELFASAQTTRQNIATSRKDLEEPRHEAERVGREVLLAQRLRSKHRWSRLVASLSRITPPRVLLTSLTTDPPQWTPGMVPSEKSAEQAAPGTPKAPQRVLLQGIRVTGQAVDHQDLAELMAAIHAMNTFSALDLKQARRERVGEHEAITFELECRW